MNTTPFGVTSIFSTSETENSLDFYPFNRVTSETDDGNKIFTQINDEIYFDTIFPYQYQHAKVKIKFKNTSDEQLYYIGFKNQNSWHYNIKLLDAPFINNLNWDKKVGEFTLYQKTEKYNSINQFIQNMPKDLIIGKFYYDNEVIGSEFSILEDYNKSENGTTILTPLRGKHILYVYLDNEMFRMTVKLKELKWKKGDSSTTVKVSKDNDIVYSATAQDINDLETFIEKEVTIQNTGVGYPESGVYKIIIDAPGDTIITNITTNLSKVVFESPVFPVENNIIYSDVIQNSAPTIVYTGAKKIFAKTLHSQSLQTIEIVDPNFRDSVKLPITEINKDVVYESSSSITNNKDKLRKITIPLSDSILNAIPGFISFTPEQYFQPTTYQFIAVNSYNDLDLVDILITDYINPKQEGEWKTATLEFDLKDAVIKDGKLNWVLKAPGLTEHANKIQIKELEIILVKNSVVNLPKFNK